MKNRKTVPRELPKSATSIGINMMGVAGMMLAVYYVRINQIETFKGVMLILLSIVIPIILLEYIFLKTYKRESTGLGFKKKNRPDLNRIFIKLLGLYFSMGAIAAMYLILPEYKSSFYFIFWRFLKIIVPIILIGSIPYFYILDMYLKKPKESYYNAGLVVLGRWKEVDTADLKNHFLGWLVKAFFLPLMFGFLNNNINICKSQPFVNSLNNFNTFYHYIFNYLFTIDLAFVTMGYLMTLRIFDSHIRTAEPTFFGWAIALLCYPPFNNQLHGLYLAYEDGYEWTHWLSLHSQIIYIIWGLAILFLIGIYVWATIPFGIRFSNLTHRGILTNGPYRYMKHPAYVSKNLSWWLMSIPFISSVGVRDAISRCVMLLLLNIIYYYRGRTEENHLSKDPVYIEYATLMNEKGIFRSLFKKISFFRYKPERYLNLSKENNIDT